MSNNKQDEKRTNLINHFFSTFIGKLHQVTASSCMSDIASTKKKQTKKERQKDEKTKQKIVFQSLAETSAGT